MAAFTLHLHQFAVLDMACLLAFLVYAVDIIAKLTKQ